MSPVAAPIPLLLVTDSAETCERIASALLSAPAFYRIERITSPEFSHDGPPSGIPLALVDGNLRTTGQSQVVRQLSEAGILAVPLVDPREVQMLQEVVLAGAAALVATPFVDTQLWETVGTALTRQARPSPVPTQPATPGKAAPRTTRGTVVALYGPKGGSGTSVLSANLAVALHSRCPGGAALVEIAEGTGSQAVLLNLRTEHNMGDLLSHFDPSDSEFLSSVMAPHSSGLRVLVAPTTPGIRVPPDLLEDVIALLQEMFDIIVLDIQSSARTIATQLLRRANAVLVVIVPEMTTLQQGRVFIEMMEATMPDLHLNIVLNRANLPSGVPADAIRRHLKMQIAAEIPDDQALVTASVNRGVPFVTSHARSPLAKAVEKLARDLQPAEPARNAERGSRAAGSLAQLVARGRLA